MNNLKRLWQNKKKWAWGQYIHKYLNLNLFAESCDFFNNSKFLLVIELKIQSFTHDSVEDARTALQLYEKYQEMSQEGMDTVRARIKEMYEFGRKVQWKIPEVEEEADSQLAELWCQKFSFMKFFIRLDCHVSFFTLGRIAM